jgi:hypothetical protein
MVSNYAVAVSNVFCIDLLHSSWQEIQNYFLISNAPRGIRIYLKHNYKALHDDLSNEEYPHLVYIEDNFIIGTKRHKQSYSSFQLGGLEILSQNRKAKVINKTFFDIVELTLIEMNCIELPSLLLNCFNIAFKKQKDVNRYDAKIINAHIQVSDLLAIPFEQITKRFNVGIHFFENIDASKLILKEVYYKDHLPLIFLFKDDDDFEFMGWNTEYLKALQNSKTNKELSIDKVATVDKILDKINKVGLTNLEEEEMTFLNFFSKSL